MIKKFKIQLTLLVAFILTLSAMGMYSIKADAATMRRVPYVSSTQNVGSTQVSVEVGYNNGNEAYAIVSATDYVDAYITMVVYYDNDSSSKTITKSFSQTTYSDMSYECSGTISRIECYFDITSSDGYKSIYLGT